MHQLFDRHFKLLYFNIRPALTIPKTPMLMKRQPKFQRQNHLTAEERELERIKEAKANLAKKKLMAAKEHRKSLDAQSSTAPGKKPLTRPIGFNFATDNRVKEIDSNKQSTAVDEAVDFVKTLRKQQDFNFNPGRTRPEPFVFRGKEPTRENKPGDKVETLAERCAKFTTKTPVRFRTKPRKETEKPANFMDVMAFQNENSNDGNFHAKPLNHKILEGPVGLKPRKHIPLTVPQSPAFSKLHATKNAELKHDSMVTGIPKICPLPANASPFKPHLERRKVEPIPFSFESRDKEMMQKKEEKIKKVFEAEKEAREFYAQPLPCFEPVLPAKKSKPITVPEPFDLEIEKRVGAQHEKWQKKLAEERRMEKENANFRARRATVLEMEPFVPEKPSSKGHNITVEERDMHLPLHTERRVAAWKDMGKYLQAKQAEADEFRAQIELRRIEEEAEEVRKFREQAVHKAHPVRNFKPVSVEPSSRPLTDPKTPNFSRRLTEKYMNKM